MLRHLLGLVALCALLPCSASASGQHFGTRFDRWDVSRWQLVREPRFASIGRWVQAAKDPSAIENYVTPGTSTADLTAAKDAVGVVQMMVRDMRAGDLDCNVLTAFEGTGAPSVMFAARYQGNVTPEMACVVIYEKGVNVWKLVRDKWSKVAAAEFPVAAADYHRLGMRVRGNSLTVQVDGRTVLRTTDPVIGQTGGIGIWGGEGICRFRSFDLKY